MLLKRYIESLEEEKRRARAREAHIMAASTFAIGALLSAIIVLLIAPKSGKELRGDIAVKTTEGAKVVKKNAVDGFNKASKFTEGVYSQAKNAVTSKFSKNNEETEVEELKETVEEYTNFFDSFLHNDPIDIQVSVIDEALTNCLGESPKPYFAIECKRLISSITAG